MILAYRGNFGPAHSTETHVALSMEDEGHTVIRCQEDTTSWPEQVELAKSADVFWWTQTYGYAQQHPREEARAGLAALKDLLPTVSFHLDIWWGLPRASQVHEEPFFRTHRFYSTDGGHEAEWAAAGVEHRWMAPGVCARECLPGQPRPDLYEAQVAFVGNWRGYHPEHPDRVRMIQQLRRRYGRRFQTYPRVGEPALRGEPLRDLYATVPVLVGDSCFGGRVARYSSDRIPETLGRGGYLVHPMFEGLWDIYEPGMLGTFAPGDWDQMFTAVDRALRDPDGRRATAAWAREHVLANHTYAHRVRQVLADLRAESLLTREAA